MITEAETLLDGKEGQQLKEKVKQIPMSATNTTVIPRSTDPAWLCYSKRSMHSVSSDVSRWINRVQYWYIRPDRTLLFKCRSANFKHVSKLCFFSDAVLRGERAYIGHVTHNFICGHVWCDFFECVDWIGCYRHPVRISCIFRTGDMSNTTPCCTLNCDNQLAKQV